MRSTRASTQCPPKKNRPPWLAGGSGDRDTMEVPMSNQSTTPGPWKPWHSITIEMQDLGNAVHRYKAVLNGQNRTVALVPMDMLGDLSLIAAVPDLLAALESALPLLQLATYWTDKAGDYEARKRYAAAVEQTNIAIAQAKGEVGVAP